MTVGSVDPGKWLRYKALLFVDFVALRLLTGTPERKDRVGWRKFSLADEEKRQDDSYEALPCVCSVRCNGFGGWSPQFGGDD
jgi:hypothetical protein